MGAPTGTVTFLFTDIEGSTRLWQEAPEAMAAALERHDMLVGQAIEAHGGYVFSTGGDGFAVSFARAGDALAAGVAAQEALGAERWPAGAVIRVRMAVHTGEAVERHGDYFGTAVNQAARLMALAHGGQVLVSAVTAQLAGPDVSFLDLGEHRLRDLSAPQRVFQVGQGRFPPLSSVDVVPTNLPTQRSELIGRVDEITAVAKTLPDQRLVTLTGVGGVGKTRLALAAAAAAAVGYPDGCWLVELAPISDGAEAPALVASVLGTAVADKASLVRYLSDRRVLLILDNCEHLLGEVASLVDDILESAPEVHVLATSREPLGVEGEVVRLVPSLELPPAGSSAADAIATAAVRLFVERGAAARAGFNLEAGNVEAVVEICRHLDGLPLAIELAAARVRTMPPAEIARRLSERFRLLGGGTRRAHERHRTLLAAVSWSHDLLDEPERAVFRRLAVFPASFDLDAAEAVVADAGTDTLEAVLHLVDRCLVQFDPDAGRYQLLETLRQFGADRLAEAGETDTFAERHARFFLELAAEHGRRMLGPDFSEARAVISQELDNLRGAAEWCSGQERWDDLLGLARATWPFAALSTGEDTTNWYRRAIAHHLDLSGQTRVDVFGELAYLIVQVLADFAHGEGLAEESERLSRAVGCLVSPWAVQARALAEVYSGRYEDCLRSARAALAAAEARQDHLALIVALGILANALAAMGEFDEAERSALEALTRSEEMGSQGAISVAAICMAAMHTMRTDGANFSAGLAVLDRHGFQSHRADMATTWIHLERGICLLGLGNPAAGADFIEAALLADRLNLLHSVDMAFRGLALQISRQGRTDEAARLVGYADAHLAPLRVNNNQWRWVYDELTRELSEHDRSDAHHAEGVRMQRRDIMNLVKQIEDRSGDLAAN